MRHGARPPPTLLVRRGILARGGLELMPVVFAPLVRALLRQGWRVEAEGKLCRAPSQMRFAVSSGIDWLDLDAEVMFDALRAGLNDMVDAAREERGYVVLSDGSLGVLPEEWLGRYLLLLTTGRLHEGRLRFKRAQLALLDALLADMPHVIWDKALAAARRELPHFEGVAPLDAPAGFAGTLRPYQKEALGWFGFLARFGLGGCLADDMGLGKTVQVLALLESWRAREGRRGPALVVAPRSVASNWSKEAARFTPALRTVMHLGPQRARERGPLEAADLVITTYDTMVRDIELLAAMSFDYAILDEAQAIKNPSSMRARAARGLNAAHRLALTGTPIENHVGELWSLLEFLNPGMVGTARAFRRIAEADAPETVRRLLARVLRPLILRRTKGQVAPDLPAREEHTVLCELDAQHRREYEELRARWRAEVCRALDAAERGGAAFKVLEALLRLRQAACHPGLVDAARRSAMSAKLDVLLEHVGGLVEGGAKALIFSQFTSLLDIVRKRLDSLRIAYEYLDGRTRNRAERVERFQTDPACPLFLISIKAGGLGLNLTAAEYVFILDPWWNPAVEAQAIDRAHRIGQQRTVLAYRLIARDTVEERVIELQQRKRQLVDAIMQGHAQGLADLNREDLEFLFS